ncbi:hypothetical protein BC829DRAFT_400447 [Chytridium lagenaria]|nr:hypothetical protein BC829DRAFT_400447 [Chytridium lagenaria]
MGDSEACGRLVQMGADMRCENDLAVVLASRSGHVELLRQMIDHYSPDPDMAVLACSLAAREEKFEVVELFASGEFFHLMKLLGFIKYHLTTPMRTAVEALLSQGANPHAKDGEALVQASKMGSVESVRILLMAGVDPASRDHEALISACHRITKSSHTSSPTTPSSPTLMALEAYNGVQIVRLLLKYGSSPSARDGLPLKMARQSSVGVSQAALVHALDNALRMEVGMEDMEASAQYEDELLEYQMEQYGGK